MSLYNHDEINCESCNQSVIVKRFAPRKGIRRARFCHECLIIRNREKALQRYYKNKIHIMNILYEDKEIKITNISSNPMIDTETVVRVTE